jgi:uncharacterized protein with HEPN domain
MSLDAQRLPDYLGHIGQAIERIQRYTGDLDEVGFLQSELVQDAVIVRPAKARCALNIG